MKLIICALLCSTLLSCTSRQTITFTGCIKTDTSNKHHISLIYCAQVAGLVLDVVERIVNTPMPKMKNGS